MPSSNTKRTALTGVISALALGAMLLGSAIGIGTYAGPLLAVMVCLPIFYEYGSKSYLMIYLVVAVLSLMLVPDPELSIVFVIFGWYPALQPAIYKLKNKIIRILLMLMIFCAIVFAYMKLALMLLGISQIMTSVKIVNYLFFIIGAATFVAFDRMIVRLRLIWQFKLKPKLKW